MAENVVEVIFRSKNRIKEGAAAAEAETEAAASRIEQIWKKHGDNINKHMAGLGSGIGKTAGFAAIGATALAAAGPVGALGLAVGAFGALAIPTLSKVNDYLTGTKKQAADAWAAMDPAQRSIAKNLKDVGTALAKALQPAVISVLSLVAKTFKDLAPALTTLAKAGAQVMTAFLTPLDKFIQSKTFANLIKQFADFAVQAGKLVGPVMTQLLAALLTLFVKLMPSGLKILQALLPALVVMVQQLTPVAVALAKVVAVTLTWLDKNKLLIPVLWGLVAVFVALKVSLLSNPIFLIAAAIAALAVVVLKYHNQIWSFIQRIWTDIFNFVKRIWNDILNFAKQWWPLLLGPGGVVVKYHNQIWNFIRNIWNTIRNDIAAAWNTIWNNTVSRVSRGISDVMGFIRALPGRIVGALGNAGNVLIGWGRGVIQGLLSGMSNIIGSVWNFIKGIPGKILHFLGIKSPPQWAIDAGKHIMNGLGIGMTQAKDIMGKAVTASTQQFSAGNLVASVGGGVQRWRSTVLQALRMEHLPLSLVDSILYQMQTESGGNPNAINLWDSNAKAGHPSKGLMQVIGPTFAAYHWPGTSGNIYDPLANIAAALNYARHNYGPGLRNAYGGIGTGRGYASGGISGGGWAMVGEHGRELVKLPPGAHVFSNADSAGMGGGGVTVVVQVEGGGNSAFDQMFIKWFKEHVRVLGGGNVQTAFGARGR